WVLTLAAYAWYAERPGAFRYGLVVLAFALGLMAKPMLVTLPCVLLLLDVWPLARWQPGWVQTRAVRPAKGKAGTPRYPPASPRRRVLEKLPLFALAAVSSVVTVIVQQPAVNKLDEMPLDLRVANTFVAYATYLAKTFWPVNLCAYYPHPRTPLLSPLVLGSA